MAASQINPWNLISGILGVICLSLTITTGILLNNLLTKQSIEPTTSPVITEIQEDCCSCQERWIGNQCNCYFFSDEFKIWKESRDFCASHNSSLLQIQDIDELNFMRFNKNFYWIGLRYSEEHRAWLWENNSSVSEDLLPLIQNLDSKKCVVYSSDKTAFDEPCENKYRFICKQQLT
ncbi:natural killer cells antigen CD94 [Suricata suricatta]|uniref:Natural killer cells antigen CD94 n=1 Tax=Suricata suricatta TaxID=37032 RepID=A0A673U3I4_SURSU|nr:natural killer cells antigen CD94 [Suricata suricatta]